MSLGTVHSANEPVKFSHLRHACAQIDASVSALAERQQKTQEINLLRFADIENKLGIVLANPLLARADVPLFLAPFVHPLKCWTQAASFQIVFDTQINGWERQGLFNAVQGRGGLTFVVETDKGDVFGCHLTATVQSLGRWTEDPAFFVFTLQSRMEREPRRWAIGDGQRALYLCSEQSYGDFLFGAFSAFQIQSTPYVKKSRVNQEAVHAYRGLADARVFVGNVHPKYFRAQRFVVVWWQ